MESKEHKKFEYNHARSEVSSDVIVFGYEPDKEIHLLLVHKKFPDPNTGGFTEWALPGHFIHGAEEQNSNSKGESSWEYGEGAESLEQCVQRALTITVNVKINENDDSVTLPIWEHNLDEKRSILEYLPPQTDPRRDLRGKRVISLPVMVFVKMDRLSAFQEKVVRWIPISKIEEDNPDPRNKKGHGEFKLPFDHDKMYYDGIGRLRQIVHVQPIGSEILGGKFTIIQLQKFYEAILGGTIEKSGFRKWILDENRNLIVGLNDYDRSSSNRPAQYYEFNKKTYDELMKSKELGFNPTVTKKR
jgi:ADP-ribose pyrophosphatase YjhB (NUDIX family)